MASPATAPLTPGAPAASPVAESGGGRFAARWKNRDAVGGTVVAVGEYFPDTEEGQKQRRQYLAKAKYRVSKAVSDNNCEDAIEAATTVFDNQGTVSNDLLIRILQMSVDLAGVERFAKAINLSIRGNVKFNEHQFASLVGRLLSREAPHAQVRVCLNFGLRPDAEPLEPHPKEGCEKEADKKDCYAGAEHDDTGELSDTDEVLVGPKVLEVVGMTEMRKAHGIYKRSPPCPDVLNNDRPVYKKSEGMGGKDTVWCYYWMNPDDVPDLNKEEKAEEEKKKEEGEEEWKSGWYIGTQVGGGGITFAHFPNTTSWKPPEPCQVDLKFRDGWKEDVGGFRVPTAMGSEAIIIQEEDAMKALSSIDITQLPGRVFGPDPDTASYFAHFFVLLNLEHLAEVFGFRRRWRFRKLYELVGFGIAFENLPVEATWGKSEESRRMPLPGWPNEGSSTVAFKLPKTLDPERCRFKRAESVLISTGDPLKSRVAEGSVTDMDFVEKRLVVNINGLMPEDPTNRLRYRIDLYANRTSYERQVTALLQFVTSARTRICDMLVAAGVGKVDLAVLGNDGFHGDKDKLGGSGGNKDKDKKDETPDLTDGAPAGKDGEPIKPPTPKKRRLTEQEKEGLEWWELDAEDLEEEAEEETKEKEEKEEDDNKEKKEEEKKEKSTKTKDETKKKTPSTPPLGDNAKAQPGTPEGPPPDAGPDGGLPPDLDDELKEAAEEEVSEAEPDVQMQTEEILKGVLAEWGDDADADFEPRNDAGPPPGPPPEGEPATQQTDPDKPPEETDALQKAVTSDDLIASAATAQPEPEAAEEDLDPEEKKAREIKAKTLAVADEDVDGLDIERLRIAIGEVDQLKSYSVAQRDAIKNAMAKRLTIVQGPPGTGKTHTSVRIITMWAKTMGYKPLLATSECNIAVDNIAEGLVKNGVGVCRVGRPEKVREHLEKACLDNMVKFEREARHEREAQAGEDDELDELGEEPEEGDEEWEAWNRRALIRRRKRNWDRKQDSWMRARFMEEAQVLCATTITAGSQAFSGFKFHAILIDEVAQATEASSIVPIVCRGAKQLVLCGDHCQLPPSVVSREAELRGFSLSLYSRLVEAGVPFRFLDTQYRAHPMLMEFSAECIYQGKLKSGIDGSERLQPKGIPWPNPMCPAAFFEVGVEEHLDGESKANRAEAEFVLKMLIEMLKHGDLTLNDVGVVTPYKGQVRTLRKIIFRDIPSAEKSKELEIASVDNFQGREKELIIFSAVRCNDFGGVGFLADWRRLNVMITRARRGLVVVGNAATLCKDPHWKLWLEFTERQGGALMGTVAQALEDGKYKGKGKGKGKGLNKMLNKKSEGGIFKASDIFGALPSASPGGKSQAKADEPPAKKKKFIARREQDEEENWEDDDWWNQPMQVPAQKQKKKDATPKVVAKPKVTLKDVPKKKQKKESWDSWQNWDEGWESAVPAKKKKKVSVSLW